MQLLAELFALFKSFFLNTFDYFKLTIVIYGIYVLFVRYEHIFGNKSSFIYKFLNIYSFGCKKEAQINEENLIEQSVQGYISSKTKLVIFKLILCFVGLQASFLSWGLMQERIIKYGYTLKESKTKNLVNFKNSQFLVLTNRLAGLVLSCFILIVFRGRRTKFDKIVSIKNWAPLYTCSYSSLTNVLSSWFQYESLKYVSFNTQLLAKSCKSLFVMITGKVISNKTYKFYEYFCVFLIGIGAFLFSELDDFDFSKTEFILATTLPGFICLLGYLISDSFTSTWQDNLIQKYEMSSMALMFMNNFYSCLYTLISLWNQSQLAESFKFMLEYDDFFNHIILLSLSSAIGQLFIFYTIAEFGALIFSLIMTTRQALSILLSSIVYQHSLTLQSLSGILLIFIALFLQQYFKFTVKKKKDTSKELPIISKA